LCGESLLRKAIQFKLRSGTLGDTLKPLSVGVTTGLAELGSQSPGFSAGHPRCRGLGGLLLRVFPAALAPLSPPWDRSGGNPVEKEADRGVDVVPSVP